ncbi:MAG TPA: Ig-like domain-containing protein [Candidatus Binatia bacterium]|nr:Ig-like domain-containing protein [Candidatus Binatia bacterium]
MKIIHVRKGGLVRGRVLKRGGGRAPDVPVASGLRTPRNYAGIILIASAMAALNACQGLPASSTGSASGKTVSSISITPAAASLAMGLTQQFTATATYSDQTTANVSSTATWTIGNQAIATVSSSGLAKGVTTGSTTLTATLGAVSGTANVSVSNKTVTSLSVTPATATVAVGATVQLTATAAYSDGTNSNVSSSATWSSSSASATVSASGLVSGVSVGSTTITAAYSGQSATASLTVSSGGTGGGSSNIPMFHVDAMRSGLNPNESTLTPTNVTPGSFGKLFSYLVDGYVYGEPLLVSNLTVNGATHNVIFVATENDSVYAFDADSGNSTPLWQVSLLQAGETPLTNGPIQPYTGVTSTPAIDLTTNTIYVVSTESNASGGSFRLNALDITTGLQKYGGPALIAPTQQARVPGTNSDSQGGYVYLTTNCIQRSALLIADGNVYMGFASCHSGWVVAFSETTLAQTGIFNMSPNLNGEGTYGGAGGVWMGGAGPAADSSGNIYLTTGNGPYSATEGSYGDSVMKFSSTLQLLDYFTPYDNQYLDCSDKDLAAGGLLLIPGSSPLQALAGGKSGDLYLIDTGDMGHQQANDAGATQTLWFESDLIQPYQDECTDSLGQEYGDINSYEIFGSAAFFNGAAYLGITPTAASVVAPVRQFLFNGKLSFGAYTAPSILENSYGTTPFISANGSSNGVLWMVDHGQPLQSGGTQTNATLRAYDPNNLANGEIYSSDSVPSDVPGYGIKFTSPIVGNGKVYISTGHDPVSTPNPQGEIDVYGLK